ncbi:MAG: hypothetical protein FJ144_19865 [Deltaproteobacteria bacterium]|nr:hypothetical protein [Deltaproteobacteria bacterium]
MSLAHPSDPVKSERSLFLPILCWLAGILVTFHPMLRSGFEHVPGWPSQDPRLVNFFLEHRWETLLSLLPPERGFWSPPIFFPHEGVTTYSEPLIAVVPLYGVWRALGAPPLLAYELFVLAIWSLNYVAGCVLLRRSFRVGVPAAAVGAMVFAFASSRVANMTKQQLVPHFFLALAVIALFEIFRDEPSESAAAKPPPAWGWTGVFFAAVTAQLYTAFYPFYFFGLAVVAALAWGLVLPSFRAATLRGLRRNAAPLSVAGALALVAAWPLASRYLGAAGEVGLREYNSTKLTQWFSSFLMGPSNWLYGWADRLPRFRPWSRSTHANGLGAVTTIVAAIGLFRARSRRSVVVIVLVAATLLLLTLRVWGDWSLWPIVQTLAPGGGAIRAVARIGTLLVFPAAIGVALFFEQQAGRTPVMLLVLLAAFCLAEQAHRELSFERTFYEWRTERIAREIDPGCASFFLVTTGGREDPDVHDDAMWVALASGVPTINGRSGNVPPGWDLEDAHVDSPEERASIEAALDRWLARSGRTRADVCRIEIDRTRERTDWRARPGAG